MNLTNMPFEELFQDFTESAHTDQLEPEYFRAEPPDPCVICTRPTAWRSLAFEGIPICSYACSHTLWADFYLADYAAGPITP